MTFHTVPLGIMKVVSTEYIEKRVDFNMITDDSCLYVETLRESIPKPFLFFFKYIYLPRVYKLNRNYILDFCYYGEDKVTFSSENKQEIVDLINLINSHKFINYEEEETKEV